MKAFRRTAKDVIFFGGNEKFDIESKALGITRSYKIDFEGVATFIQNTFDANESTSLKRWAKEYMDKIAVPGMQWNKASERITLL